MVDQKDFRLDALQPWISNRPWEILLVEDDEDDYILTKELLSETQGSQFHLIWAETYEKGLSALQTKRPNVVLVDYALGSHDGLELIREINARDYQLPVILLTGHGSYEVDVEAMKAGATDYLVKGEVTPQLLERTIRYAVERKQAELALRRAQEDLERRVQERTLELALAYEELVDEMNERRQAEQMLHEHEERLRTIITSAQIILWAMDREGVVTLCEGKGLSSLGWNAEEIVGQPVEVLTGYEPEVRELIQCALAGDEVVGIAPAQNNHDQILETRYSPHFDEDGEIVGVIGISSIITDRVRAEIALQSSKTMFESLFQSSPDATLLIDQNGRIQRVNQQIRAKLGYQPEELIGKEVDLLLPAEARLRHLQLRNQHFQESDLRPVSMGLDNYCLHNDGHRIPVDITYSPLLLEESPHFIMVIHDITERRRAEDALRESEARFRTIFNESAVGIELRSLDGCILAANPALVEMLGRTEFELRERECREITHPDDYAVETVLFDQMIEGKINRYQIEKRYLRRDEEEIWGRLVASIVRDENDKPQFVIGLVENITDQKRMQAELIEVQRRLTESREAERLHLAQELHDGPVQELYAVSYQLKALQDISSKLPLDVTITEKLARLQEMVTHIVQGLRTTAGELRPPTLAPFGLQKTIQSHASVFQQQNPGMDLQLELQPDGLVLPERFRLALFRIYQQSLINIVRHARAKKVLVRFQMDVEQAYLEIRDDGVGFNVPESWIDFVREDHFGLAGCAERAESIGGRMKVESEPDKGTTLIVTVPIPELSRVE
jgi:PAS domain S-box-containing protein